MNLQTEPISDMAMKASLPVTVSGLTLFGVTVPELIQLGTLVYVVAMAANQIYLFILRLRHKNEPKE